MHPVPGTERHLDPHAVCFHADPMSRFRLSGLKLGQFPNAEYMGHHGLHIGVHQDVGMEEMEYVLKVIDDFLESHQN